MDLCRICLSSNPEKDLSELEGVKKREITFVNVMFFCLNIQVTEDSKITRKLCKKCFNKVLRYYEFKSQAIKSDVYLKSLNPSVVVKTEVFVDEEECEIYFDNVVDNDNTEADIKCNIKEECLYSDDELLSVLKKVKSNDEAVINNVQDTNESPKKKSKSHQAKTQVCEECGKSVKNMKAHRLIHTPQSKFLLPKCEICNKVFSTLSNMRRHRTIHSPVLESCEICHKVVKRLNVHKRIAHNKSSLPHACPHCGRRFVSQSAIDAHVMIHSDERPFHCDLCSSTFKRKLMLEQHIKQVHNKEKLHLCQFCSKSFFKKYHLLVHIRMHTKEKPYKCEECGKTFTNSSTLKNHQSVHSDEKNFACILCNMTFSRNSYLIGHMRVHTREKRHPCKYCGVKFRRSDHKKRHEHTAHERHLVTAVEHPVLLS